MHINNVSDPSFTVTPSEDPPFQFNENSNEICDILPSDYPTKDPIFSTIVYSIYVTIFIVALLGNVFVCYIVLQSPRMRTVTNYFIMNLAVGDILITVLCVPFTSVTIMLQYWPFGAFMCPFVSYVGTLSVLVSAYTLVAISIDKWMLIMYPLKPRISKRSATYIIAVVWIFAGITVVPSGVFTNIQQPNNGSVYKRCDKYLCNEDYSSIGYVYEITYATVLMLLQYIIPLKVLVFTYTSIAAVIWCHRIPGEAENTRDKRMARSKRKMIKMMITVVLVYTVCWLPYNLFMVLQTKIADNMKPYVYITFHLLAMSHACYNPIIYCYMNTRFRDGLFLILRTMPCFKSCYMRETRGSLSSGFQRNACLEGTDSTTLQRNNTFTTYITLNRKNRTSTYQNVPRSASSVRRSQNSNGTRCNGKNKYLKQDVADEPI
ncbi:RYamide receptor-like isoform X1 [Euwallacea fornicatus]|uniref:RYamide receptor-like isoform X1 n=1 Tax=Euwallacea fornicatus TaxID=995702 RepID=UPI00338E3931